MAVEFLKKRGAFVCDYVLFSFSFFQFFSEKEEIFVNLKIVKEESL